jgi:hypothetical protein
MTPRSSYRQAAFSAWERQAYICCHDDTADPPDMGEAVVTDRDGDPLVTDQNSGRANLIDGFDFRHV